MRQVIDAPTMPLILGDRTDRAYRFRRVRDAGARLITGSDTLVASPDAVAALGAVTTRLDSKGQPFHPEERLSVYAVLRGYTADAAFAP